MDSRIAINGIFSGMHIQAHDALPQLLADRLPPMGIATCNIPDELGRWWQKYIFGGMKLHLKWSLRQLDHQTWYSFIPDNHFQRGISCTVLYTLYKWSFRIVKPPPSRSLASLPREMPSRASRPNCRSFWPWMEGTGSPWTSEFC